MYQPRVSSVATPGSANRSQRNASRIVSRLNISRTGQPFSPGLSLQRLNQSLNRSLQASQYIEETPNFMLELYGMPLPVLVTEVLTLAEKIADISVKLSESGWAWLVCGRRLFVWKYKSVTTSKVPSQCRELTLPPSDLAHKAELVCVYTTPENQVPSAIAVSPEGTVRYWPSIVHEGSSVETNADLHGQECYSLTNAQSLGCILATTTSTLMIVTLNFVDGQSVISCRNLKISQGMLAGIQRRVSSLFFGSMPNQSSESKLVKVLVSDVENQDEKLLYVLTGSNLQKWKMSVGDEKMVFECDMERFVKENFIDSLWGRDVYHVDQTQTWLIDMQLSRKNIIILAAGLNVQVSNQLCYAFASVDVSSNEAPPSALSSFCITKFSEPYLEESEEALLGYRFLLSATAKNIAFLYGLNAIYCFSVNRSSEEPDVVEFKGPGDRLLGAGTCEGLPLFFPINHGVVSLRPMSSTLDTSMKSPGGDEQPPIACEDLTFSESFMPASLETASDVKDLTTELKRAFLEFCKQSLASSQAIVDSIFPPTPVSHVETTLNTTIITISERLIDDFPASDRRWAESVLQDASQGTTSTSLLILHQMEDKQKAHEVYVGFLKGMGLWNRMSVVTTRDMPIPTRLLLREHAEKIAAIISLHNLRPQYGTLIDQAIKLVLGERKVTPTGKLTNQDVFFREISQIHQIVPALITSATSSSEEALNDYVNTVISVNAIIQTILLEACKYRNSRTTMYPIPSSEPDMEYLPWTGSSGNKGLRTLLIQQHATTVRVVNEGVKDVAVRGNLYQQLVELADLVLDGYRIQLDSISNAGDGELYLSVVRRYEVDRYNLIRPLLEAQQYDRAAALAEKYCDFKILVEFCEETNNKERLQRYMLQFADKNFDDFVFKWYLEEGKQGKLLSETIMRQGQLRRFLDEHSNLSWLHDIQTNNYVKAHHTLKDLALSEKNYLSKKKTLLSLSKLNALALDKPLEEINMMVQEINREHELILYQESLPNFVLQTFGVDPDAMRVMSPSEIIELYISEENVDANEYDFKKALDLLQYVDKDKSGVDYEATKLHIWSSAIKKNTWTELDMDSPVESCSGTVFVKIVDLVYAEGTRLSDYLPPVNDLLNFDELSNHKASVEFFIRAAYEKFDLQ